MTEPLAKKQKMAEEPFSIPVRRGVSDYIDKLNTTPYAAKELFLWELVSNAARALFKIRKKTLYEPHRIGPNGLFIEIIPNKKNHTLSVVDNGVGMTEDDLSRLFTVPEEDDLKHYMRIADQLVENKSTADEFYMTCLDLDDGFSTDEEDEDLLEEEAEAAEAAVLRLGFFAAFTVADRVEIATKHCSDASRPFFYSSAGDRSCFFRCDDARVLQGAAARSCFETTSRPWGTTVTLHLKQEHYDDDYLDVSKLKALIDKYPFELCPYPISICNGLHPPGDADNVILKRDVDVKEAKRDMNKLERQFKSLGELCQKILFGNRPNSPQVIVSDRFYDLPTFLSLDKKTFAINPRNWIIKKLREIAKHDPKDMKNVELEINGQYQACRCYNMLYNSCHKSLTL